MNLWMWDLKQYSSCVNPLSQFTTHPSSQWLQRVPLNSTCSSFNENYKNLINETIEPADLYSVSWSPRSGNSILLIPKDLRLAAWLLRNFLKAFSVVLNPSSTNRWRIGRGDQIFRSWCNFMTWSDLSIGNSPKQNSSVFRSGASAMTRASFHRWPSVSNIGKFVISKTRCWTSQPRVLFAAD